jgi:hypothetical protein
LKSIGHIVPNGHCNNDLRAISSADRHDSNKRLDFQILSAYVVIVQCNKESVMTEERRPVQEAQVPDLLTALTASGLGGARPLPHALEASADSAAPRSWLARCLKRTFAREDAGGAPASSDFDSEWAGGSYAQSRRLLDAALHAARQRKGVL